MGKLQGYSFTLKTVWARFHLLHGKRIQVILIAGVVWTCGLSLGFGRDVLELESRYRGDGWFDYRLRTLEDPFFKGIHFNQLLPDPFTNYVANTLPDHWTNFYYGGTWTGIMFDASVPQPRINEISFSVRSSSTHFRRANYGFHTGIFLEFVDRYYGGSAGGYVNLDCLIPCAPEEADGSPAAIISRRELIPDVTIDQLIVTNGDLHGVSFSWSEPSTVELQGSHDLTNWITVARFFGNPPQTTWTTNVSLNAYGEFFRLSLIANGHLANALAAKAGRSLGIPIGSLQFVGHQIRIGFVSVPNAVYEVDYCEMLGRAVATKQIVASKTYTTLYFDVREPRSAAFFKARQLVDLVPEGIVR